jgi:hypothetical protein
MDPNKIYYFRYLGTSDKNYTHIVIILNENCNYFTSYKYNNKNFNITGLSNNYLGSYNGFKLIKFYLEEFNKTLSLNKILFNKDPTFDISELELIKVVDNLDILKDYNKKQSESMIKSSITRKSKKLKVMNDSIVKDLDRLKSSGIPLKDYLFILDKLKNTTGYIFIIEIFIS